MRTGFLFWTLLLVFAAFPIPGAALEKPQTELGDAVVTTKLGTAVDTSIVLTSSEGKPTTIGDLLADGKPLIIVPVYYSCPRLCGFVLSAVEELLQKVQLELGSDYKVAAVSFDSSERPELAAKRRNKYTESLSNAGGWEFFVGEEANVSKLMQQLGFGYKRDGGEFAHSSAIILLTPRGEISQYFTGIDFPEWDVKLALVDASRGSIGSPFDHILLYCFRFDPTAGKYTFAAYNVMRFGGLLTVVALGAVIVRSARSGKQRKAST